MEQKLTVSERVMIGYRPGVTLMTCPVYRCENEAMEYVLDRQHVAELIGLKCVGSRGTRMATFQVVQRHASTTAR